MDIQVAGKALKEIACDALVVSAVRAKTGQNSNDVIFSESAQEVDAILAGLIRQICSDGAFKGNLGEMTTVYTMGKLAAKRIIVVGLGSQESLNAQALRSACAIAARHLQNTGARQVALALSFEGADGAAEAQVEGALLGLYTFKKYLRTDDAGNGQGITKIWLVPGKASANTLEQSIGRGSGDCSKSGKSGVK